MENISFSSSTITIDEAVLSREEQETELNAAITYLCLALFEKFTVFEVATGVDVLYSILAELL